MSDLSQNKVVFYFNYNKLRLYGLEKISFKLRNILHVIHDTIHTGFKKKICLSPVTKTDLGFQRFQPVVMLQFDDGFFEQILVL